MEEKYQAQKANSKRGNILALALLAALFFASFGAGYLLGKSNTPAPIIIEQHSK